MSTDRELLELAGKAVGVMERNVHLNRTFWLYNKVVGLFRTDNFHSRIYEKWNPLTDDGDALRLAVKLELRIAIGMGSANKHTSVKPSYHSVWSDGCAESHGDDAGAATRRAIVRAAAEIGQAMS